MLLHYWSWCSLDKIRENFLTPFNYISTCKDLPYFSIISQVPDYFFSHFLPSVPSTSHPLPCQLSILLINRKRFYLSLMLSWSVSLPLWEWENPVTLQKEPWRLLMSSCSAFPFLVKQALIFRTLNKLWGVPISCSYTCCIAKVSLALQQGCTIVEMSKVKCQIQLWSNSGGVFI